MDWLINTNSGLAVRIGIGAAVFLALAILDIRKNGIIKATRWREYAFLLFCVVAAMCYGIVNDLITSSISWEYFYYGKGLDAELGNVIPPDSLRLHLAATVVGMKATWSAGLLIGAILLIANNPRHGRLPMPYRDLTKMLLMIATVAIIAATVLGVAGSAGGLNWISHDFAEMFRRNEMHPQRFVAVFGIHLGGYAGGLLGLIVACGLIFHRSRRVCFGDGNFQNP